jgi:hypothetical protein
MAVGALCALSFFVQLLAISVHYLYYVSYVHQASNLVPPSRIARSPVTPNGALPIRDRYIEMEFNPEYAPILGQWWIAKSLLTDDPNPALHAPWAGLGFAALHADVPLKARLDLWFLDLLLNGLKWINAKLILGSIALLIVWIIVAEELFAQVFWRGREATP